MLSGRERLGVWRGGVFFAEHSVDGAASLGAGVVRSKDAATSVGGEGAHGGMEFSVEDHGVESAGGGFIVWAPVGGAGIGQRFSAGVIHQGIEAAISPEAKAFLDAAFDVAGTDASGPLAEDAGEEGEGSL